MRLGTRMLLVNLVLREGMGMGEREDGRSGKEGERVVGEWLRGK